MIIDIPSTLTARAVTQAQDWPYQYLDTYDIVIEFGGYEVLTIPTDEEVILDVDQSELDGIVNRCVAKWLRTRFI